MHINHTGGGGAGDGYSQASDSFANGADSGPMVPSPVVIFDLSGPMHLSRELGEACVT
jgi:hypothetical protein